MAELAVETTTEAVEPQVEEKSRFKTFNVNHPRTAKVVGIAAVTALTTSRPRPSRSGTIEPYTHKV